MPVGSCMPPTSSLRSQPTRIASGVRLGELPLLFYSPGPLPIEQALATNNLQKQDLVDTCRVLLESQEHVLRLAYRLIAFRVHPSELKGHYSISLRYKSYSHNYAQSVANVSADHMYSWRNLSCLSSGSQSPRVASHVSVPRSLVMPAHLPSGQTRMCAQEVVYCGRRTSCGSST